MTPPARALLALALFIGSATAGAAQEPPPAVVASVVDVGSRVRVRSTAVQARMTGTVVALDERTMTLAPEAGPPLRLPVPSITELDIGLGTRRNTLQGLAIGVLSGIGIGFAFTVDPQNCGPESSNFCSRGEAIAGGTIVFGALGAGIGALIKTERWAPVRIGLQAPSGARGRAVAAVVDVRF